MTSKKSSIRKQNMQSLFFLFSSVVKQILEREDLRSNVSWLIKKTQRTGSQGNIKHWHIIFIKMSVLKWTNTNISGNRLHRYSCALTMNSLNASEHQHICSKPTRRLCCDHQSDIKLYPFFSTQLEMYLQLRHSLKVPGKQLWKKWIQNPWSEQLLSSTRAKRGIGAHSSMVRASNPVLHCVS